MITSVKSCCLRDCPQDNPQPIENFHRNRANKDGYSSTCKQCKKRYKDKRVGRYNKEYQDKYRDENRAEINRKSRERAKTPEAKMKRRAHAYGLSVDELQKLIDLHDGLCAICNKPCDSGRTLSIDHDHSCCPGMKSCGKCVRGLLCIKCNRGLGYFVDSIEQLEAAVEYLKRYVKNPEER